MRNRNLLLALPILGAIVFFVLISISWAHYEKDFSFIHTNISRLGRPSMNPDGYGFMMAACIATNIFMLPYYASLGIWRTGEKHLDLPVLALKALCYLSVVALILLSVLHADLKIPHRISGGVYFISDALMMFLGAWIAWKHPKVFTWLVPFCLTAACMSLLFLYSAGKASWAEWTAVGLNFGIAIVMGWNARLVLEGDVAGDDRLG
jgi:hypothetical membrane protein